MHREAPLCRQSRRPTLAQIGREREERQSPKSGADAGVPHRRLSDAPPRLRGVHFVSDPLTAGCLQRSPDVFAKLSRRADTQSMRQEDPFGFREVRLMAPAFREIHDAHTGTCENLVKEKTRGIYLPSRNRPSIFSPLQESPETLPKVYLSTQKTSPMILTPDQITEFNDAAKPLILFLRKNGQPRVKVIVDHESAEVVEGIATTRPPWPEAPSQNPVMETGAKLTPKAEAKAANNLPRAEQLKKFEQSLEAHDGGNQPA